MQRKFCVGNELVWGSLSSWSAIAPALTWMGQVLGGDQKR